MGLTLLGPLPWPIDNPDLGSTPRLTNTFSPPAVFSDMPGCYLDRAGGIDPSPMGNRSPGNILTDCLTVPNGCGPFFRVKRWSLTYAVHWENFVMGLEGYDISGSADVRAVNILTGLPPADEHELESCTRIETYGYSTQNWVRTTGMGTPAGSSSRPPEEVYCAYYHIFWMDEGDNLHVQFVPAIQIFLGPSADFLTNGSHDDFNTAVCTVDASAQFPGHLYDINLTALGIAGDPVGYASGTVTLTPSEYWTWGGLFDPTTGAPT